MLKQLHNKRYVRRVTLKNGKVLEYKGLEGGELYYCEVDKSVEKITDWDALLKELFNIVYYDGEEYFKGLVDKKNRVWCYLTCGQKFESDDIKLYKDEFLYAEVFYEIELVSTRELKMRNLIEQLCVEDYIAFLKDNGLNCVVGL